MKIEEARRLIANTKMDITTLASELGKANTSVYAWWQGKNKIPPAEQARLKELHVMSKTFAKLYGENRVVKNIPAMYKNYIDE